MLFELIRFCDYDSVKITELLKKADDFPWILGQLMMNRVGGTAYYVLRESDSLPLVGREFRNSLRHIYEMNRLKTKVYKETLVMFGRIFRNACFPYAFLKGAYLTSRLYPEGLRTSNDYDILIRQRDITACEELLRKHGLIQGFFRPGRGIVPASREQIVSSRMNRGETVPFVKESDSGQTDIIEVDLNFSLDYQPKGRTDAVGSMLENIQEFDTGDNRALKTLSAVDFLIHLCVHLFKEATVYSWVEMNRDLSLYKFCDIYVYLLEFGGPVFYELLSDRIYELGLCKECFYSFWFCSLIYRTLKSREGFPAMLEKIKPDSREYMKQILDPIGKTAYCYHMSHIDWLFCTNKKQHLKEV